MRFFKYFGVWLLMFIALCGVMPWILEPGPPGPITRFIGGSFDAYAKLIQIAFGPLLDWARERPSYFAYPIFLFVGLVPIALPILAASAWFASRPPAKLSGALHRQLAELSQVESAIAAAQGVIAEMKSELTTNLAQHEELRATLDKLQLAASEGTEELRHKLDAIDSVRRHKYIMQWFLAFISGVFASLAASAIWMVISSKLER